MNKTPTTITATTPINLVDLLNALDRREQLGMTPEVDGARNPDQVAATLESFADEIRRAGTAGDADRYYALLVEHAAECMSAAAAFKRSEQAADQDMRATKVEEAFNGRLALRRDDHRHDRSRAPEPARIPLGDANAVREPEESVAA